MHLQAASLRSPTWTVVTGLSWTAVYPILATMLSALTGVLLTRRVGDVWHTPAHPLFTSLIYLQKSLTDGVGATDRLIFGSFMCKACGGKSHPTCFSNVAVVMGGFFYMVFDSQVKSRKDSPVWTLLQKHFCFLDRSSSVDSPPCALGGSDEAAAGMSAIQALTSQCGACAKQGLWGPAT